MSSTGAAAARRIGAVVAASATGGESTSIDRTMLHWTVGQPKPAGLDCADPFLCALVPRPTAWLSVHGTERQPFPFVCLLDGYNASSDRPPTVMLAAAALPTLMLERLLETDQCCLSVATPRDFAALDTLAASEAAGDRGAASFSALGLEPAPRADGRPPAVASSPCQMDCRLMEHIDLDATGQAIVVLEVEHFTISGSVLARQAGDDVKSKKALPSSNPDVRRVAAKLEARLVQPLGSLGQARFSHVSDIWHMLRPEQSEAGVWGADRFRPAPAACAATSCDFEDVTYCYMTEEQCCLGYNPMKQICQPRPVGWISTYGLPDKVPHIAPYSFFGDVGRGERPFVAFSASRRPGSEALKDAHKDAEETGVFCWNVTNAALAEAMNWSAATLDSSESEFDLAKLEHRPARLVDAPVVDDAPLVFECRYVRTVPIPRRRPHGEGDNYIIIGEVVGMQVHKRVLTGGVVDVRKLCPVARLGYSQEYTVVDTVTHSPKLDIEEDAA